VIPIVLALLVALTASFILYRWTKKRVTPDVAVTEDLKIRKVAVAKVAIPAGTRLNRDVIAFASFLQETLPPGAFSDPKKVAGRVVLTPLRPKELILNSKLAPVSVKVGGVAVLIKPGKRAVTVKGGKVLGVAGFIRPGNRVDIMLRTKESGKNKIVFENVRVLATGSRLGRSEKGKPQPVDTFTLEVTPEEGERLALASTQGTLQFALRNITDNATVLTTGANMQETLAQYRPIVPTDRTAKPEVTRRVGVGRAPVRAAPAPRKGLRLEVIKGLNRTVKQY
ncbi:MAG: Flp pilus assembly protein CpaB, partial [Deltaproteobacteria bacterium]|nr:Flp pilus assembly protein CpaB [Deltaproteobacteria bacterium]